MNKSILRYSPVIVGVLLVALIIGLGVYFILGLKDAPKQKKVVQQITVIKPPPPPKEPPPPPEQEEEEIEEKMEEEIADEPEPTPDQGPDEPAGEELGLDAEGTVGGDSFGLRAKKGGRGLLAGGGGGYGGYVKAEINKALLRDDALKYLDYVAVVTLSMARDGSFRKVAIAMRDGGGGRGAAGVVQHPHRPEQRRRRPRHRHPGDRGDRGALAPRRRLRRRACLRRDRQFRR